jgi:mannose-6-phosphate isomerase
MEKLYPLKFEPILKDKIWGGSKLKNNLNKSTKSEKCGESWEISGVQDNVSVVKNGFLAGNALQEVVEVYMGDLVGEKIYNKFGIEFPLLIKFIDANDDLSIQVHPDDAMAKERHNAYGKTEMWYVLESEKEAQLISGFNQKMDKEKYLNALSTKKIKEILNFEPTQTGDVFFMPAGRVHALGAGLLIAEIQQTSDITYRIYDWDRVDASGKGRELHTELALDAIDYKMYDHYKTNYEPKPNKSVELADCAYFTTNYMQFDKMVEKDYNLIDSFVIYICTAGSAKIIFDVDQQEKIAKGETVLIPADIKSLVIKPDEETTVLEVYIK